MANELTPRQETFARLLAEGKMSQTRAYYESGYNPKTDAIAGAHASRLAANGRVKERVAQLRDEMTRARLWTRSELLSAVRDTFDDARQDKQHSASVAAARLYGDLEGWQAPKQTEVSVRPSFAPRLRTLGGPQAIDSEAKSLDSDED